MTFSTDFRQWLWSLKRKMSQQLQFTLAIKLQDTLEVFCSK